jgi:hypothetical protein
MTSLREKGSSYWHAFSLFQDAKKYIIGICENKMSTQKEILTEKRKLVA